MINQQAYKILRANNEVWLVPDGYDDFAAVAAAVAAINDRQRDQLTLEETTAIQVLFDHGNFIRLR